MIPPGLVYAPWLRAHEQLLVVTRKGDGLPTLPRGRMAVFVVISHGRPEAMFPAGRPVAAAIFSRS